jgi:hypothetical protein
LDSQNLDLIDKIQEKLPPWTNLNFHRCPNCLLTIQTHPSCPVAVCLAWIPTLVIRLNTTD